MIMQSRWYRALQLGEGVGGKRRKGACRPLVESERGLGRG